MTVSRLLTMRSLAGAILAFGVVWPSGVRAGCLYAHGAVPERGVSHLDWLAQAGALSIPGDSADPSAPVSPCAGMRCSNEPAPAPPAVAPTAEQWGCLTGLAFGPEVTSSAWRSDDPAVRPRHRGVSPFHPPR